jgi:hypothetical protein
LKVNIPFKGVTLALYSACVFLSMALLIALGLFMGHEAIYMEGDLVERLFILDVGVLIVGLALLYALEYGALPLALALRPRLWAKYQEGPRPGDVIAGIDGSIARLSYDLGGGAR